MRISLVHRAHTPTAFAVESRKGVEWKTNLAYDHWGSSRPVQALDGAVVTFFFFV